MAFMYPEDPVLVAYVRDSADFERIRREQWYHVPQSHVPKGLYAAYIAFYFGHAFGDQKYAIHYYAANLGHELTTRRRLFPHQPDHPRADQVYYKIQLGELQARPQPIISLRWRRILFIHTTWDRFQDATEINDLFLEGGYYVDRLYAILKEHGLQPERHYHLRDGQAAYRADLAVPTAHGWYGVRAAQLPASEDEVARLAAQLAGLCPDNQPVQDA